MSAPIALGDAVVIAVTLIAGFAFACAIVAAMASAAAHIRFRRTGAFAGPYPPDWTSWAIWLVFAVALASPALLVPL